MNFLRLNDYLLSVLFENDEIIAIDKPYGINSHTNDSKVGNLDFIHEGLIEIFEKQLNHKLYIVHRLDQTTTGVIIFAKSIESAKKYAEFFFNRQVKKTYLFVTNQKPSAKNFVIDKIIIHKGRELEAKTEFQQLKKTSNFQLWEAHPLTGRNHQIRIHAQAAGISLLGDEKYEGKAYPFLCLHNRRIEFPNGIVIESKPPRYFEDLSILDNTILAKALFETDRRLRLFKSEEKPEQCFRLVHNKNDFKDFGFTIDQLGSELILSCYNEQWTESDQQTFTQFANILNRPIVVQMRYAQPSKTVDTKRNVIMPQSQSSAAVSTQWIAQENQTKYELRTDSGQSFGLFLDQRLHRDWVLNNSTDKSVLNLFSYTCAFSVAAALGKAQQVVSVDTNKNVLNWGRKNFELNGVNTENYKFLCRDSMDFLEQSIKKSTKFDLIICDPPAFSRGEKGVFKIETHLEALLKNCLKCLKFEGTLLFSTHFENFYVDDIRQIFLKVKKELGLPHLEINYVQSSLDFELVGKKSILKSFLVRLRKEVDSAPAIHAKQNEDLIDEE